METYRHHFETYAKVGAIFLALVGTATGFLFADGPAERFRTPVVLFILSVCVLWILGALAAVRWLMKIARLLERLEGRLDLESFPTRAVVPFGVLTASGVVILALGCVLYLIGIIG